jgi:imidazoleglycerol-phosphate dehydratase
MMAETNQTRSATIERKTGETDVRLTLGLDGGGAGTRATGVGFLDHMLDLLARHGRLDLDVQVAGDLQTGAHHTAEDTAIVLGQALDRALGDRMGITRYGAATVPMDEARASCAIDISGRPFTLFEARLPAGSTGGFEHELTEEFFRALANAAKLTLHLQVQAGTNAHHMIEAAFKAFARALREAVSIDPSEHGVPSTKGTLTS